MKIAYAYEFDAADSRTQSGRPFSILRQLERRAGEVVRVFPLRRHLRYAFAPKYVYHRRRGLTYRPDREPHVLRSLARQVERRLHRSTPDLLFAPGSHLIAELNLAVPKVFCADATFANVLEFYDSFMNCAPGFVTQGHEQDRRALANCAAAVFPSVWAARAAIEHYGAQPDKVHVIPFGANVAAPGAERVAAQIAGRGFDPLRLLFIGRDWLRKGGDVVLATCEVLRRRGVPLRLDVVGVPRVPATLPAYARWHGLLDRRDPEQGRRFEGLLERAHFLFVPSRAENYGMSFCEAAAFGVPSVSTAVGGIPTIVRHGETGIALPPSSPPEAFADAIEAGSGDPRAYVALAHAARRDYEARLNWEAFGARLMAVVHDCCHR